MWFLNRKVQKYLEVAQLGRLKAVCVIFLCSNCCSYDIAHGKILYNTVNKDGG